MTANPVAANPAPEGLDLDRVRALLLDSATVGLAVAAGADGPILLCNEAFQALFPAPAEGDLRLVDIVPGTAEPAVRERLLAGDRHTAEVEVKLGRRRLVIAVEISPAIGHADGELMIQCQNVSKLKELEYMIDSYSKMIERQNRDLAKEKDRVERLLLNIMPRRVYEEWREFGITTPERFDEATVLLLDFVGFTEMSVAHDPPKLIAELHDIVTSFDRIVEEFGCERLKTIGDAYLAASGLPEPNPEHARNIARAALRLVRYLERRNAISEVRWHCRIGISSRPVIGSVVGTQKYVYDIFGPGVNLASRLEPLCGPMQILLDERTHQLLAGELPCTSLGTQTIRGFGEQHVYRLEGATGSERP
ncbi:MAG: adenylate/guanylate cyclase domain-containing protein [Geminicoccaceae bacterium]